MSKRKGNVSVLDFMVCLESIEKVVVRPHYLIVFFFQKRGWEPEAVINWLALAGWGTPHDQSKRQSPLASSNDPQPPERTLVMTLPELIEQVCFHFASSCHAA